MIGTLAFFTVLGIVLVTVGTYAASRRVAGADVRKDTLEGFWWAVGASAVCWGFVAVVVVLG